MNVGVVDFPHFTLTKNLRDAAHREGDSFVGNERDVNPIAIDEGVPFIDVRFYLRMCIEPRQ